MINDKNPPNTGIMHFSCIFMQPSTSSRLSTFHFSYFFFPSLDTISTPICQLNAHAEHVRAKHLCAPHMVNDQVIITKSVTRMNTRIKASMQAFLSPLLSFSFFLSFFFFPSFHPNDINVPNHPAAYLSEHIRTFILLNSILPKPPHEP